MRRFAFVCAASIVVVASSSACHLLGLAPDACDPADATTCPTGQSCNAGGVCGAPSGPPPSSAVAENEDHATLLAAADDGTLFWSTGAAGGCVRRLPPGGSPDDFDCDTARPVTALAVLGSETFFAYDGAESTGSVVVRKQDEGSVSTVLASNVDVAPLSRGLANITAVKTSDGTQSILFSRAGGGDADATRIKRAVSGAVSFQATYSDLIPDFIDNAAATLVLPDESASFVGSTFQGNATAAFRSPMVGRDDGGGTFGFDGAADFTDIGTPSGHVGAIVPLDNAAAKIVIATVADDDSGVLIKMGTNTFAPVVIAEHVDPDNPRTHARGMVTDGFFLYYSTAGTPSPGKKRGILRLDLFTDGATPERLTDLDGEGAGIALQGTTLFYAEPDNDRISKLTLPAS